jgi:demethylmenaquinone methyltransferase/2-methoxy-6-polyprenyl-1,4-benzoquinol methylase
MKDHYKWMGHIYDLLGDFYSGRQITYCKEAMIERIRQGEDVLFAGVGHGKEAIKAAEKGARVTVVDLSETMLSKFNKGLNPDRIQYPVRQIHDNIFNLPTDKKYDYVFANFFLNVFKREPMDLVVKHLTDLTKPGGFVVVGDFAFPNGSFAARVFQRIYWYIGVTPFFLITHNAFHNIYNYPEYLKKHGLEIVAIRYFTLFHINSYWSILAQKPQ